MNTPDTEERKAEELYPTIRSRALYNKGEYEAYVESQKKLQSAFLAGYSSKQSELEERMKELECKMLEIKTFIENDEGSNRSQLNHIKSIASKSLQPK